MTPSQMLARIEALGSVEAKYIARLRKQVEDPAKDIKSKTIVLYLLEERLITKADAKKLLAPPAEDKVAEAKPAANPQSQPAKPIAKAAATKPAANPQAQPAKPIAKAAAPPAEDKIAEAKPAANSQSQPAKPVVKAVTFPTPPVVVEPSLDGESDSAPVNNGFDPMFIFAFLNFHRRFIFGALLLAGVGYLLVYLNNSSKADKGNESVAQSYDPALRPRVTEPTPYKTETISQVSSEPVVQTVDQQIDWLLQSAGRWENETPEDAMVIVVVRHEQLEKLIANNDLKPSQQAYCIREYIKAVGALSEINQKVSTGVEGIDEKIANIVQAYEESEDEDIAALAKAVLVSHLAWRFAETSSDENLEALQVAFFEKRDAIAKSELANRQVTRGIRDAVAKAGDDPRLREIAAEHLSSVLYVGDNAVVDLAKNLYFPEVDWKSIASRLQTRSPGADSDVQLLLTSAKKHPDIPLVIYSTIATAINWYKEIGEDEKADRFLAQFEEVGTTITSKRIYDEVQRGIQMLKDADKERNKSAESDIDSPSIGITDLNKSEESEPSIGITDL